jgi:hypothetical protein
VVVKHAGAQRISERGVLLVTLHVRFRHIPPGLGGESVEVRQREALTAGEISIDGPGETGDRLAE